MASFDLTSPPLYPVQLCKLTCKPPMNLESLLITPVQRIPRYNLLLQARTHYLDCRIYLYNLNNLSLPAGQLGYATTAKNIGIPALVESLQGRRRVKQIACGASSTYQLLGSVPPSSCPAFCRQSTYLFHISFFFRERRVLRMVRACTTQPAR